MPDGQAAKDSNSRSGLRSITRLVSHHSAILGFSFDIFHLGR